MSKHTFLFLILLFSFTAQAQTFERVKGTYAIQSCKNLGTTPSEDLCQYETMVIRPDRFATAIYFYKGAWGDNLVRSFGFPGTAEDGNGRYQESGDSFASYSNLGSDYQEATAIQRINGDLFHFTRTQFSRSFNTNDRFELDVQKISEETPDLPNIPDPEDPD